MKSALAICCALLLALIVPGMAQPPYSPGWIAPCGPLKFLHGFEVAIKDWWCSLWGPDANARCIQSQIEEILGEMYACRNDQNAVALCTARLNQKLEQIHGLAPSISPHASLEIHARSQRALQVISQLIQSPEMPNQSKFGLAVAYLAVNHSIQELREMVHCPSGKPVCGEDGITYPSQCVASRLGVNVSSPGPCPHPEMSVMERMARERYWEIRKEIEKIVPMPTPTIPTPMIPTPPPHYHTPTPRPSPPPTPKPNLGMFAGKKIRAEVGVDISINIEVVSDGALHEFSLQIQRGILVISPGKLPGVTTVRITSSQELQIVNAIQDGVLDSREAVEISRTLGVSI